MINLFHQKFPVYFVISSITVFHFNQDAKERYYSEVQKPHFPIVVQWIDATAIIGPSELTNEPPTQVRILRHHTRIYRHHKNSQHQYQHTNQSFTIIQKTIIIYK